MSRAGGLALVALVAAVIASCGSSGGGDYISKADAICKSEASKAPGPNPRPSQQDSLNRAAFRERLRKKLAALKPPARLAASVKQYDALTQQIVAGYRQVAGELGRGDVAAVTRTNLGLNQALIKRSKLATQIGYKQCGQPAVGANTTARATLGTDPAIIARADAACKQADFAQYALIPRTRSTLQQTGKRLKASLPALLRAQKQLAALKLPAKDKPAFDAFLAALDKRLKLADQRAAAAIRGDALTFSRLSVQAGMAAQQERGPATQLGFEICGQLAAGI